MTQENKLINDPIAESLIKLSSPIMLTLLLQMAYQLTDTFWVGRLGADAMAAVSLSTPIIMFLISLGTGIAISGTILVAQYKGQNNQKAINYISAQALIITGIFAIIISIIGYCFSPQIIKFMKIEENVLCNAVSYMRISFIGITLIFCFAVFQALLKGVGEVILPLYISLITVILNFVLDPLLLFGYGMIPSLDVSGAAVATVISYSIATIMGIGILITGKKGIKLNINDLKPNVASMKRIIALGFPASIEHSAGQLKMVIVTCLVTIFGTSSIAAYGIGVRILALVSIPVTGLDISTTILVGQNMGAGKIERVYATIKFGAIGGFLIFFTVGILVFASSGQLASIFMPDNMEVINSCSTFLKIASLGFGLAAVEQVFLGAYRGAGNTFLVMIISIGILIGMMIPLAYFLSRCTSLAINGIWLTFPLTSLIALIVTGLLYKKGITKNKIIEENSCTIQGIRNADNK